MFLLCVLRMLYVVLSPGDKAGRICIFEGHQVNTSPNSTHRRPIIPLEYKFYTEFQSHEPEFDCLKSLEIEEKINMIKWSKRVNNGLFLLACNGMMHRNTYVHPCAAVLFSAIIVCVLCTHRCVFVIYVNGVQTRQSNIGKFTIRN